MNDASAMPMTLPLASLLLLGLAATLPVLAYSYTVAAPRGRGAVGSSTNICTAAGPYKSPKIAVNRTGCGGCGSLAARAVDTYRQKSLN